MKSRISMHKLGLACCFVCLLRLLCFVQSDICVLGFLLRWVCLVSRGPTPLHWVSCLLGFCFVSWCFVRSRVLDFFVCSGLLETKRRAKCAVCCRCSLQAISLSELIVGTRVRWQIVCKRCCVCSGHGQQDKFDPFVPTISLVSKNMRKSVTRKVMVRSATGMRLLEMEQRSSTRQAGGWLPEVSPNRTGAEVIAASRPFFVEPQVDVLACIPVLIESVLVTSQTVERRRVQYFGQAVRREEYTSKQCYG